MSDDNDAIFYLIACEMTKSSNVEVRGDHVRAQLHANHRVILQNSEPEILKYKALMASTANSILAIDPLPLGG